MTAQDHHGPGGGGRRGAAEATGARDAPEMPDAPEGADRTEDAEEDRTILDAVRDRLGFRKFFARHAWLDLTYRIVVGVLGVAVIVVGGVLIPLPGPGWLIVFAGLAILATEFAWAERLLQYGRRRLARWTEWVMARSLLVRGLIGLGGLVFAAAALALYLEVFGVPFR